MNAKGKPCQTSCSVYGCKSVRHKNPNFSFHNFPKPGKEKVEIQNAYGNVEVIDRREAWILKLKMGKKVPQHMKVCFLHFTSQDYYYAEWVGNRRLLPNAVPSQNLPSRSYECAEAKKKLEHDRASSRSKHTVARASTSVASTSTVQHTVAGASTSAVQHTVARASTTVASTSTVCMPTSNEEEELDVARTLLLLNECNSEEMANKENVPLDELATSEDQVAAAGLLETADIQFSFTCDRSTQVKSGDIVTPFISLINTNKKLSSMTGLENLELLDTIVELCEMCSMDKRVHKLTLKERIILTFMKMKTGLTYAIISIMFNTVSSNTCITIFHNTVILLHSVLKNAIPWPSSEEIFHNMPYCFSDFQKVRVVIDCIEIPLMKPKCLCCRIKTYSHYKGTNTIKFMTGVSPAGLITFISKGYGGRASDKAIFEQSGLITKLNMCVDHIMLDKGFRIEEITRNYGIKVIQPPFLIKKKQFSAEEALLNAKIAKARVHIERSNQRIKVFKIFNTAFPMSLLPIGDELFVIACAIVNLSAPILAEDKFMK